MESLICEPKAFECRMKINVYCTCYFRVVLQLLLSVVRTTYEVIKWNKIYHRYEYAQFISIEWIYVLYIGQLRPNGQINHPVNEIFDIKMLVHCL